MRRNPRAGYGASYCSYMSCCSLVEAMESFIAHELLSNPCTRTMDPLSITASAITIIQVTTDLINGCGSYYKSVKSSKKETAALIQELESFGIVLKSLKNISQEANETARQQTEQLARDDRTE